MEILKLAEKALHIQEGLLISKHRNTIKYVFSITGADTESIKIRLATIDSLYTTQAFKNPCLLDDLAIKLSRIPNLEKEITKFIDGKSNELSNKLIDKKHGVANKRADSLISKYCYFLSDGNFPIYDSLVENFIKRLTPYKKEHLLTKLIFIKKSIHIDSFNKLDCIMWLYEKIQQDNLYDSNRKKIENPKEKYIDFIKEVNSWIEQIKTTI